GERPVGIVKEPGIRTAAVDDGGLVEVVRLIDQASAVGVGQGGFERSDALRYRIGVDVQAADFFVQVEELLRRDVACPQSTEAVFHANVVGRKAGEAASYRLLLICPDRLR